jgi:hypothetical protein
MTQIMFEFRRDDYTTQLGGEVVGSGMNVGLVESEKGGAL